MKQIQSELETNLKQIRSKWETDLKWIWNKFQTNWKPVSELKLLFVENVLSDMNWSNEEIFFNNANFVEAKFGDDT